MTGRACYCGAAEGTRLYPGGIRCPAHTPAALAGQPEPATGCCAPLRCYCQDCLKDHPDTAYHLGATVIDLDAVKSGKRRASLAGYRSAQANERTRSGKTSSDERTDHA